MRGNLRAPIEDEHPPWEPLPAHGRSGGVLQPTSADAERDARQARILRAMDDGYFLAEVIFDEKGRPADLLCLDENPAAVRMFGQSFKGRRMRDIDPEHEPHWYEILGRVARTGQVERLERCAGPERRWYDFHVFKPDAERHRVAVVFRDVTERRQREAAATDRLQRQTRLFEGIVSTTPDFVYVFDLRGRLLYANRRLLEVWGMSLPDAIGKTWRELGYEQWHHDKHMREFAQVVAAKRPIKGEVPFRAPLTGVFGVYEYIFTPVIGPDGEVEIIAGTTRDVTERKLAEEKLRESEARNTFLLRLGDALRSERDPIAVQEVATRALGEHLGADRVHYAEVEGPSGDTFVVHRGYLRDDMPPVAGRHRFEDYGEDIRAAFGEGRSLVVPDVRAVPDHSAADLSAYDAMGIAAHIAVPLVKAGRVVAFLSVNQRSPRAWTAQEVTIVEEVAERTWAAVERARAEQEQVKVQQVLSEANRQKDQFLAMLAHELRNPLAPIRTSAGILRARAPSDPVLARCRDVIERQTAQMSRLLDDLLDVSRLSRGKLTLQRAPVVLRDVLDAAIETSRPLIDQAGHRITVDAAGADVLLEGDAARLTQVFANLLNNAAKYSDPGGRIDVAVRQEEGRAVVRVRDTGIGIAPEMLGRVFDLFAQGEGARSHAPGGLGIGLSLARRLVEMHGGTIAVASEGVGQGSEFTVSIPVLPPKQPADTARSGQGGSPVPRRRVLIVDDNVDVADTTALFLGHVGCDVRAVYGGEEAVREAERFRPEIVLMDIGMPGVDGYEACRRIRGAPWGAGMLLVAASGWGQSEDRRRSARAGFDVHLVKPVDPDVLVQLLRDMPPIAG